MHNRVETMQRDPVPTVQAAEGRPGPARTRRARTAVAFEAMRRGGVGEPAHAWTAERLPGERVAGGGE